MTTTRCGRHFLLDANISSSQPAVGVFLFTKGDPYKDKNCTTIMSSSKKKVNKNSLS